MNNIKNNPTKDFTTKFRVIFKDVFHNPLYSVVAVSVAVNVLLIYYFILLQSTTLTVFFQSNNAFYNWASVISTILISALFGMAVSLFLYLLRAKSVQRTEAGNSVLGGVFGAISSGCPVCGAWLVSALGIGGGLVAFPLQGLELKGLALLFLGWSVYSSSNAIYNQKQGICPPQKKWQKYFPYAAGIGAILLIFALPVLATKYDVRFSFKPDKAVRVAETTPNQKSGSAAVDAASVIPPEGYTINATYGDIGPKMLESGVIDLEKFKSVYERAGQPLTQKQLKILTQGSDEKITITQDNAYFLINFLWALGLANKNPILDDGPIVQYAGLSGVGGFASTGGWTLGKSKATDYFSKSRIVSIDSRQQEELEDFAYNSYRPCCNNSTAFADCNHGMAALALGEIMAANGATADEMFEAQKYFNAFWFPQQYIDLANYFKAKEGKSWQEVNARVVMGKDYSTASGWSRARNWLAQNNLIKQAPSGGGGCGV